MHLVSYALAALFLAPSAPAESAPDTTTATDAYSIDRAAMLRQARRAQGAFERLRRVRLPTAREGLGGRCDERVGRFCLVFSDDPDADPDIPDEHELVTNARHELIDILADARLMIPEDAWLAGQSVRYLHEAGRIYEAETVSEGCRADAAWCAALQGFVFHQTGRIDEAEDAFDEMLELMEEEEREAWESIDLLLPHEERRLLDRDDPGRRADIVERFWWLADPLHSQPGNAARTDHLARQVISRIYEESRRTDAVSWGSDLAGLTIRYGAPIGHAQYRPRGPILADRASIISYYAPMRRAFLPPIERVLTDSPLTTEDWDLRDTRAFARHRTPGIERIDPLEHVRSAVFRRGVDTLVVVSSHRVEAPDDTMRWSAFWAHGSGPGDLRVAPHSTGARSIGILRIPSEPTLVSVEARTADESRARRARWTVLPRSFGPDRLELSDLLLLDGATRAPDPLTLETLLESAEPLGRIVAGEAIRVAWEMYGLPHQEAEVQLSIRLISEARPSFLRRIGIALGLARPGDPATTRWDEEPRADDHGITFRTVEVALPSDLSAGLYTLQLSARLPGEDPVVREERFEVSDR